MSDTLQLRTIAEGIEEMQQKNILLNIGCEFGQGYHFAKPLNETEMSELLRQKSIDRKFNFISNARNFAVATAFQADFVV